MTTHRPGPVLGGYGAGTAAGLIWGLAFLIPVLLHGWGAVTVTAGRYLAYGALSLVLFALGGAALRRIARVHWRPAVLFAVTGNVGYYLLLVLGIELAGAPVTNIVIGCIPVSMAVVGNLLRPSYPWRRLALPIVLVTVGMLVVNVLELTGSAPTHTGSLTTKALGLLAALAAVVLWTWYGLANATFLAEHPELPLAGWSTVVGLATGAVTLAALPLAAATHQLDGPAGSGSLPALVVASLVLGILVSWGATALWNVASARLTPTAAGMLINFETLAGFAYIYAALADWPPVGQLLGFALILAGVVLIVRLPTATPTAPPSGDQPHPPLTLAAPPAAVPPPGSERSDRAVTGKDSRP
ncbi:DMT family transporter [Micromonospora sp. KLBMP9576]|uniref:DMT family transporter n=1 Tax=Micromonospora sp. KLBMP9576 TaxID=3424769 RepID=UPI003D8C2259